MTDKMIRTVVDKLANKYGFNADEAMELVKTADVSDSDSSDKIAVCKKNIDLWQKKLAEGKVKDEDKQREKIEKEQKKLEKLESKPSPKPKAKEEPKPKPKAKEEPEPKPKAKKEPKEEPKPKPKAKEEPKEKRIKRFSPVMVTQLTAALSAVKVTMTDKLKKEFQQYVEDLTDDDYRKDGLADHMRTFAKLNEPDETNSEDKVVDVTLKELQDIVTTSTVEPPGTYWDADNGRFVKGPEAEDDEDFEDTTFEGMKYVVGQKTGRVYEARDSGDVFAGFFGVGKFKKMTK